MTKILLIETATEVCSVAIAVDGAIVAFEESPDERSHAAMLTQQIDRCSLQSGIALAALDAVAVSNGPGSYTSLRVGISVAKGICYALNKPLIAVDTLLSLAQASLHSERERLGDIHGQVFLLPMIDARRSEVWTSIYDDQFLQLTPPQPLILENNSFIDYTALHISDLREPVLVVSGNGMEKVGSVSIPENTVLSMIKKCSAKYLSVLALKQFQNSDFQDIAYFEPIYMKPPNITTSNKSAWHEKR